MKEFTQEGNRDMRLTLGEWLGRYVYFDIHEIFFSEFPIILYDRMARLELQNKIFQGDEPKNWTH